MQSQGGGKPDELRAAHTLRLLLAHNASCAGGGADEDEGRPEGTFEEEGAEAGTRRRTALHCW